ncbi:MAG TPA: KpsF/GutQ family sugar-phosphate isomerase [Ferruginibacter sp.]|nr:KpsF/GutQ family sugar-phosphate isomerase [Ferruginibacter sp.]HRE62227.1 KpsF/GutQ family sugar-phosphate isomerase [Ferruginibacter sp.]
MKSEKAIINSALNSIQLQWESIANLKNYINADFKNAVEQIASTAGRLVVSGIGKSAIVAQKITATMNSTGTPALFMHAADAIHGDLGMVQPDDIVLIISKSGDSPEIKVLVPLVKNFGNTVIGLVGNMQGYLAKHSDIVINSTVSQEACPNNLAPTTSTTAQMVMGDALAICLMETKQFKSTDFAKYHPGGALGKKLYLRVAQLVQAHERPMVSMGASIKETILEITNKRLGAVVVLDQNENIAGIITDGDIRRMLEKYDSFATLKAEDIMGKNPKTIQTDALAVTALEKMRANNINQLVAVDNEKYVGILHLQELIKEGII